MNTHQDPVVIACAANRAYSIPLAVMLRSAADHLAPQRELVAYVIDDGLGDPVRSHIVESLPHDVSVRWLAPARSDVSGLPLWGRMPVSTYDKLGIAECLPVDLHKVIWLDCDMLVLADLAELWDTALGEATLLAVRDALVPDVSSRFGISAFNELGLDSLTPYFNAGMMVIDLRKWRAMSVAIRTREYLRRYHERVFFWDQEALNAVLSRHWTPVDESWNWSVNLDRLSRNNAHLADGKSMSPRIVHFTGNIKPWIVRESTKTDASYFETVDKTAWRGWRPKQTVVRSMASWYVSSRLRRFLYPAEQVGMHLVRRLTQRQA